MVLRLGVPLSVSAAIIGATLWLSLDQGGSQQVVPEAGETQVEGRIQWGSSGHLRDGSTYDAVCEADAYVIVERDTITQILEHGDRPTIDVGAKIDHDVYVDLTEDEANRGYPPTAIDVYVYRDEDGTIHTGCPPESTVIIDGVSKTYGEWKAEGRLDFDAQ